MRQAERWEEEWDCRVDLEGPLYFGNTAQLVPILQEYDGAGLLGSVVLDLGCGPSPVTNEIASASHRRILVDREPRVMEFAYLPDTPVPLHIDARRLVAGRRTRTARAYELALAQASGTGAPRGLNAIVAGAILNYMPYRAVLRRLDEDLLPGGQLFLANMLGVGCPGCRDYRGMPKSHAEVTSYVASDLGYTIDRVREDADRLLLVAHKHA